MALPSPPLPVHPPALRLRINPSARRPDSLHPPSPLARPPNSSCQVPGGPQPSRLCSQSLRFLSQTFQISRACGLPPASPRCRGQGGGPQGLGLEGGCPASAPLRRGWGGWGCVAISLQSLPSVSACLSSSVVLLINVRTLTTAFRTHWVKIIPSQDPKLVSTKTLQIQ